MKPAPRRWQVSDSAPLPGHPPLLGRILAARGHDDVTAATFLDDSATFHDPFGLRGMSAAVDVLGAAIRGGERIAVYGDYDADGVTACAMLSRALRAAGVDAVPYIPNRMSEGYGLHGAALAELHAQGVRCVITVDCGTSSVDVAAARPAGMRLVVTDHHLPLAPDGAPPALAPADALINPKQPGCTYPFDGLAGAGVAWKLLAALETAGLVRPGSAEAGLGLAALGTVADMMPLRGENRLIVQRGMAKLRDHAGIRALCAAAGLSAELRASDIGFGLGPRINAAGRMEDARLALDLCLCDDDDQAFELASRLDSQNRDRQAAVAIAMAEAETMVAELPEDEPAIVLGSASWPMGIVGLVAGRLTERYARPSFIVCLDPAEAKGSARSIASVHIVEALDGAASTLLRYGGHRVAAGFSLEAARFDEFADAVRAAVAAQLGDAPRERVVAIDGEITTAECVPDTCDLLDRLEPCGQGNAAPVLAMRDCTVLSTSTFGAESQHLRVALSDGKGIVEAIAFFKPLLAGHLPRGRRVDVCIALERDEWQGMVRVRARLRDIRPVRMEPTVELSGTPVQRVTAVSPAAPAS
jgi:single-stranded-DNA-specific exonuclease